MTTHAIATPLNQAPQTLMQYAVQAASVKMILGAVPGALVENGDPQTGWMKEEVLEQTGCSFQVDN